MVREIDHYSAGVAQCVEQLTHHIVVIEGGIVIVGNILPLFLREPRLGTEVVTGGSEALELGHIGETVVGIHVLPHDVEQR